MSRARLRLAAVLTLLTALFAARVAGQALVAWLGVTWLPSMERWYSGLLPYPVLLPVQVAILLVQVAVDAAAWVGHPVVARPRPRPARFLRRLSYAYALAMLVRYAVTGSHLIPIVFHWVLAAYLFTLARAWAPTDRDTRSTEPGRRDGRTQSRTATAPPRRSERRGYGGHLGPPIPRARSRGATAPPGRPERWGDWGPSRGPHVN